MQMNFTEQELNAIYALFEECASRNMDEHLLRNMRIVGNFLEIDEERFKEETGEELEENEFIPYVAEEHMLKAYADAWDSLLNQ